MDESDFKVWALDIENNTFEREHIGWYIRTYCGGIVLSRAIPSTANIPFMFPEYMPDWMVKYYEESKRPEDPKVSKEPQPLLDSLNEYIEQLRGEIKAEDEEDMLAHYRKRLAECENLRLKAQLMIEHYEDEKQEQETAGPSFQF